MHKGYLCCPLNKGNSYLCLGKLIPSPKGLTSTAKRLVQHRELAETRVSRKVQERHQYKNLLAEVKSNNTLNARINCPPEKESTHVRCVPKISKKKHGESPLQSSSSLHEPVLVVYTSASRFSLYITFRSLRTLKSLDIGSKTTPTLSGSMLNFSRGVTEGRGLSPDDDNDVVVGFHR